MYWRYLKYVFWHKVYVFQACRLLKVSLWQALVHDWSKFLPDEFIPYAKYFYGGKDKQEQHRPAFDRAWLFHQRRNPHHWQAWLLQLDNPKSRYTIQAYGDDKPNMLARDNEPLLFCEVVNGPDDMIYQKAYDLLAPIRDELNAQPIPLPMPEKYLREMVADWYGAGRAITGKWEAHKWYKKNAQQIRVHPETRARVETLLSEYRKTFEIMNYPTFETYLARKQD